MQANAKKQNESIMKFSDDFPRSDHQTWLELVQQTLSKSALKKLKSTTYDGLEVQPLYSMQNSQGIGEGLTPRKAKKPIHIANLAWDIECISTHPDAYKANQEILEDLEKGATSIGIKIDPAGENGTRIQTVLELKTLLSGVFLNLAPIRLNMTEQCLETTAIFLKVLAESDINANDFFGNFGEDPLGKLIVTGKTSSPIKCLLDRMADISFYVSNKYPNAKTINISSEPYHNAGCSEAQELAIAMATSTEYLRSMIKSGLTIDEACDQVCFTLTADADIFMSIAKFRAAHELWRNIALASGANERGSIATINGISAPRILSRRDPWTNILRTTSACLGASIGGADAITILPFETASGLPSILGRRIARNTQIILQEEASIGRVIDPSAGSWMIESLTKQLTERAWLIFQGFEANGGLINEIESGSLQRLVLETAEIRENNIACRREPITGVSEFADIYEAPIKIEERAKAKASRTTSKVRKKDNAGLIPFPQPGKGKLITTLTESTTNQTLVGDRTDELRTKEIKVQALPPVRLAEGFEKLRTTSEQYELKNGRKPQIFIANIGQPADYTTRAMFITNLFATGGFEIKSHSNGTDLAQICTEFQNSVAQVVVICSTDDLYRTYAEELIKKIKVHKPAIIYVAGEKNKKTEFLAKTDTNIFVGDGCNVLNLLTKTFDVLGIKI